MHYLLAWTFVLITAAELTHIGMNSDWEALCNEKKNESDQCEMFFRTGFK